MEEEHVELSAASQIGKCGSLALFFRAAPLLAHAESVLLMRLRLAEFGAMVSPTSTRHRRFVRAGTVGGLGCDAVCLDLPVRAARPF